MTAPIHVWVPPQATTPASAKVALMPVAGDAQLARRIESEILNQRPAARADVALFTADQLANRSPIRLASTADLTSELAALQAARSIGADILLQGEILISDLEPPGDAPAEPVNMNEAFFQRPKTEEKHERILLSWRIIDSQTSESLGAYSYTLLTEDAARQYPDLASTHPDATDMLIAASAREAWKLISPTVVKERVRLAVPWFQPGAWRVRRGVAAARRGEWELAEQYWKKASQLASYNASAQHNLAVAHAAREDFVGAKQQLLKATGPLALRLPTETLFWLDQRHRRYCEAHGLGKPAEGWAFPEPIAEQSLVTATPVDMQDLPWWTAIPFTKPPEWTWQGWLRQAWVF